MAKPSIQAVGPTGPTGPAGAAGAAADTTALQAQITALEIRVTALEAGEPIEPEPPIEPPVVPLDRVYAHEVTAALPDMVCVELRDPPLQYGKLYHNADGPILEGAYEVTSCSASPTGAIRVVCKDGPFGPWYFDEGNSAVLFFWGIGGVPGANGLFQGHKVDANTMDLINTTFSGNYSGGGHFRNFSNWVQYPPADNAWGWVCGRNADYFRAADTASKVYLDRAVIGDPANWPTIDGRKVTAVYRKSTNYRQGFSHEPVMGQYGNCSSLKHFVYLQLDGPVTSDKNLTVNFPPGANIDPVIVLGVRAIGFHVSGVGHRPSDASKYGYWSLHVMGGPGEGMVDLAAGYNITTFDVVDGAGQRVLGPLPLELRIAGWEPESHVGVGRDNILGGYPDVDNAICYSSASNRHKIVAINGNVLKTETPHGFANGQKKRLHNMGGDGRGVPDLNNLTVKVQNCTADSFTIENFNGSVWVPATFTGDYNQWIGLGLNGYVHDTYESNRAGTDVYGCDYSALKTPGTYHLAIAGIGVSDPIYIGEDAWDRAGKIMAAGEYHHRWGIDLDGRYGYTRPAAHKDGVTGPIYESDLPYYFSTLGAGFANVGPPVQDGLGARPPWKRTTTVPFGGSWADAGDWVTRIQGVAGAIYQFCEIAQLCSKPTHHSVPKVSEILDPVLYAGTDDLPESVHQAIFGADTYRVCQYREGGTFPAGSVPSGLGMGSGTGTVSAPAHLSHDTNFCYAPDHPSTRAYCFAAAKISSTLKHFGCDQQASVWLDSAIAAWNWCEHIRSGEAAVDAYYNDVLHVEANTGWSRQQFLTNIANMNQYADDTYRAIAAACLWRATGEAKYQTIVETALGMWFDQLGPLPLAAWEYHQTPGANAAQKQMVRDQFVSSTQRVLASWEIMHDPMTKTPCRSLMIKDMGLWNMGSQGMDPSITAWALIGAHYLSRDVGCLKALQDGVGFIYGANPLSMSFVAQAGRRWPGTIFNQDSYQMGEETPLGIGAYGYSELGSWAYAFGQWASSSNTGLVENPTPNYAADHIFEREIEPNRYCWPIYEAIWEAQFNLKQMERSIQQTVLPLQVIVDYLHGWD